MSALKLRERKQLGVDELGQAVQALRVGRRAHSVPAPADDHVDLSLIHPPKLAEAMGGTNRFNSTQCQSVWGERQSSSCPAQLRQSTAPSWPGKHWVVLTSPSPRHCGPSPESTSASRG